MTKVNPPAARIFRFMPFLWSIVLAGIVFCSFYVYSTSYLKTDKGSLAYLIEQVRTRNLKENTGSELRRIEVVSERLDKKILALVDELKKDSNGEISASLKLEIISVLGLSGRSSLSLTSLMLSLLKDETEPALIKEILLALKRLGSVKESIEQVVTPICESNALGEVSVHACALLLSRGGALSEESIKKVELYSDTLANYLHNIVQKEGFKNDFIKSDSSVGTHISSPDLYYSLSMFAEKIKDLNSTLVGIIAATEDLEARVAMIQVIRDNRVSIDSKTIRFLVDLMQYDSEYRIREAALLALIGIGTDESLKLAKSYGHKFLRGEVRPQATNPHPFRMWAIKASERD